MSNDFPSTRQIHDIGESEPGAIASHDPAALEETEVADATLLLLFGIFGVIDTGKIREPQSGDTEFAGVVLIGNLAGDYENRKFIEKDTVPVARRGYWWVRIDTNNKPTKNGVVRISYDTGIEGFLTTNAVNSLLSAGGIRITQVLDTVAEVYLDGSAQYSV